MLLKVIQILIMLIKDINPQLNPNESLIKNKLIDLLFNFRGLKFVTTVVLKLRKKKVTIKHIILLFIRTQKQKNLLMKVILMMYLKQFMLGLYQKYKNFLEKVWEVLFFWSQIILLIFQSTIPQLVVVLSNYQKNQIIQKKV